MERTCNIWNGIKKLEKLDGKHCKKLLYKQPASGYGTFSWWQEDTGVGNQLRVTITGPEPKNGDLLDTQKKWLDACKVYVEVMERLNREEIKLGRKKAADMWSKA